MKGFLKSINRILIKGGKEDFLCADLGTRYLKFLVISEGQIKDIILTKVEGNSFTLLREIIQKHNLSNYPLKVSIKGEDTIIRYIEFPKVEASKLKEAVGYQLGEYIPFSQDEVYFDIYNYKENVLSDNYSLILAAVKKEKIDNLLDLLNRDNITLEEITLDNIALINLFLSLENEEGNIAILDMGYSSCKLNVLRDNTPYLSREIPCGGCSILNKLSLANKISLDEAEELFINNRVKVEFNDIFENFIFELSEEIKQSFDYVQLNTSETVKKVYLTGGFSYLYNIERLLSSSFEVEVSPWEFSSKKKLNFSNISPGDDKMLAVVLGLSL